MTQSDSHQPVSRSLERCAHSARWRLLVAAAAAAVATLLSAPVFADSGSVRYSYEKVEIGDEALWTLIPHAESKLRGDEVGPTTVRKAFRMLKSNKNATYGDTSMSLDGSEPDDMVATIEIPSNKSQYALVIMSEVVYTLSGLGVSKIRFPDQADGPVSRADIPISAYTLTIPLFRALPKKKLVDARIRLPDGTVLPSQEVYRRWEQGDQQLISAMYEYLDSQNRYTLQWVLQTFPELDIPYVDQVVPLLAHEQLPVRQTALDVLANKRNRQAVLEAVADRLDNEPNDKLARNVAEFLGKSDDEDFQVLEHFYLLEHGSNKEAVSSAETLGGWSGDDRVVDQLGEELTDKHTPLAKQSATSLAKLDAHDTLAAALDDGNVADAVKMQIAQSLAGDSVASARLPGLNYLANHLTGREARQNIRAMQSLDVDGARSAIEAFLTHDNERMRATAAEVLQGRGSLKSLDAMAEAIDKVDNSEDIADAGYKLLVEKPTATILNYTEASNAAIQRMAYRALGTRAAREGGGSSDVFQTLKQGASSSDARIRGAAARGLGAVGGDQALGVLESMTDDPKAEVRRDVALALGNYDEGVLKSTLVSYLDDDSPKVIAAAINTFEKRGASHVWDRLQTLVDSQNADVKAASLSALAALVPRDEEDKVSRVISRLSGALSGSQTDKVVLTALDSLGSFPNGKAVQSIAIQLNSQKTEYRAAAVRALAATGQPDAADLIVDVLNDKSSEVRLAAVRALRELKAVQAKSALKDRLDKEDNKEIRGAIQSTLKQL